jgi:dTDP-4-dehydrorhamnose 3,5-epimerase
MSVPTVVEELPGVLLLEPPVFGDRRGYFKELWNQRSYSELGIPDLFRQDNVSFSGCGVLRGLHYQNPNPQGKLVSVLHGEIFDVAVDIRAGSPDFGRWVGYRLSAENHRQLYVPAGFAHGFAVLSESALVAYKCTELYDAAADAAVRWDDPDIGVEWPAEIPQLPQLSEKDENAPRLRDVPPDRLPQYPGA